jgi:hypothetical protein
MSGECVGPFEYLLLFAAVILALAVADLAASLQRLLSGRAFVKWDWLAPLAALVAFLKIVTQWWSWFGAERIASGFTFEMYLGVLASSVVLFLLAATALPDETTETTIDLREYYASVFPRYWSLFALHWVLMTSVSIWAQVQIAGARVSWASPVFLIVPLAVSLAIVRNRGWHTICLVGLIVLYIAQYFGHQLG